MPESRTLTITYAASGWMSVVYPLSMGEADLSHLQFKLLLSLIPNCVVHTHGLRPWCYRCLRTLGAKWLAQVGLGDKALISFPKCVSTHRGTEPTRKLQTAPCGSRRVLLSELLVRWGLLNLFGFLGENAEGHTLPLQNSHLCQVAMMWKFRNWYWGTLAVLSVWAAVHLGQPVAC